MEEKLWTFESINNPYVWGLALMIIGLILQGMFISDATAKGFGGEGNRNTPDITLLGWSTFIVSLIAEGSGLILLVLYCERMMKEEANKNGRATNEAIQDVPIAEVD